MHRLETHSLETHSLASRDPAKPHDEHPERSQVPGSGAPLPG